MKKNIYLDHAATTPTDPQVVKAMGPYWTQEFGNPSALYSLGQYAKRALDDSRQVVAKIFNCQPEEIIFTGNGTESINLAIKGLVLASNLNPAHVITSNFEHHAVLNAVQTLKNQGHTVSLVPVDADGLIMLDKLWSAIKKNTVLISIMMANNEVGTIQPIQEIGAKLKKINQERKTKNLPHIYFHTDACQAAGALDLNVEKLHVDLMTINGSKIYGPKGVGVLYVKRGTTLKALIDGGGQEKNLRSGTENVPGIVGLAVALKIAAAKKEKENKRLTILRDWLIKKILTTIPKTLLNGHAQKRLPNNINISILDIEGEAMLLYLDEIGIQASTGSACTAQDLEPSHVIRALGRPYEAAHGSLRLTLGRSTTKDDLIYLTKKLPSIVKKLRQTSPVSVNMDTLHSSIKKYPREIISA
ncbi:MAG: aminotransferase class V-fold PLP-dependent enzyme [Patescibacteria group bacterium]|jgi:cysteine desulfurase